MESPQTGKRSARAFACPRCRSTDLQHWKLPHPMQLHWVVNPALAFNELVLGQRMPSLQLVCNSCPGHASSRTFVPCPSCGVVHDSRHWTGTTAYGNWLGLICPTCSKRIPCLWNVASLAVLAITAPLWYLPHLYYFRDRPTIKRLSARPSPKSPAAWWRMGLAYGSVVWAATTLLPQLLEVSAGQAFRYRDLLVGALFWYCAGLIFGFVLWFLSSRRKDGGDNGT